MAPQNIKIIYFDAKGRAECMRILLAAAGQKYDDVRVKKEDWPEEKPKTPFGQLPVLEVDGKKFGETVAQATYLAREFGFYGKNNLEGLQIDQVVQLAEDFIHEVLKVIVEEDKVKKAEELKTFQENAVPKFFGFFEKLLKENGSGFFVGPSATLADFYVFGLMEGLMDNNYASLSDNAALEAHFKKVASQEKIKAYLAARK